MANTRISDLTASASNLAASDLVPVVQTPNVGPVKMTGTQIKTGIIGAGSVSIASGKTFTASNTLTLAGTDSTTMTFPSTSATLARTDAGNTFTGNQVITEAVGGSGLTITGATQTTSQPVLNLTQTWNGSGVTFTGLKFNATDTASAAGSLLLDLQVGGASAFNVTKAGGITFTGTADYLGGPVIKAVGATAGIGYSTLGSYYTLHNGTTRVAVWGSSSPLSGNFGVLSIGVNCALGFGGENANAFITRPAAATLQLGAADAAAPVAQTFKVQSVVAGTSNTAGANFTIQGSQGTGTGAGGSIIFQVAPAGSTGTAQNAYSTALTIASDKSATFAGTIGFSQYQVFESTANNTVSYSYGTGGASVTFGNVVGSGRCLALRSDGGILWSTTSNSSTNTFDTYLMRPDAATLQFGAPDAATAVPQTLRVQSGTGTNSAGATWTRRGSLGTGTAAAGNIVEQTGFSGTSGTTAHTAVDREIIVAQGKTLTDNTATSLFEIALPTLAMAGGVIEATVICTDGTDMQSVTETITYAAVNKGGVYTKDVDVQTTSSAVSAGTITNTWAFLDGTNKVTMRLTSDTSLTPTKFLVYYKVRNNSEQATTIL